MRQKLSDTFFESFLVKTLPACGKSSGALLIIRLDAIGDYILFRNFLQEIRTQFKNRRIVFCGNIAWKDFALELDRDFFDRFVTVDRIKFRKNPWYRRRVLAEIRSESFATAVHPVYSRDFYWGDQIIRLCGAESRIGMFGDSTNMTAAQKTGSDRYYSRLISDPEEFRFEFDRNRFFIETWLRTPVRRKYPEIRLPKQKKPLPAKGFVVIFPGASQAWKRWKPESFAEVCKYIEQKTPFGIIICGSHEDSTYANQIRRTNSSARIQDMTGKTSLMELAQLLARAEMLLSNDTSAVHIAAAVGTRRILTLCAGNHYGRFLPYPTRSDIRMTSIFPPAVTALHREKLRKQRYYQTNGENIQEIGVEAVNRATQGLLLKK